jgi:hypothetical protein
VSSNQYRLIDVMNLLMNELGFAGMVKLQKWMNEEHDNAWDDRIAELQVLISHPNFKHDYDYQKQVWTYDYKNLVGWIDRYKQANTTMTPAVRDFFAGVEAT